MTPYLDTLCWPASRLGEALDAVARRSGLLTKPGVIPSLPTQLPLSDELMLERWVESAADSLGVEAEPVGNVHHSQVLRLLRTSGPALLKLRGDDEPRFLALLSGGRRVSLLGPDQSIRYVPAEAVRAALCNHDEQPLLGELDEMLDMVGGGGRRRERVRQTLLRERLRSRPVRGVWQLRLPPGVNAWQMARQARLPRRLLNVLGTQVVEYGLWLLCWWLLGRGAWEGRLEHGWLLGWGLLLLLLVPLRASVSWNAGTLAIDIAALIRQRLLSGALRLQPDELRGDGVGRHLGRILESQTAEFLAMGGTATALLAFVELAMAATVLIAGAQGQRLLLLLACWLGLLLLLGWRYATDRDHWTRARLDMTHTLIEQMVGHRTRLAQELPERWHLDADRRLTHYQALSQRMDRAQVLSALLARSWLIVGLLGLSPAFISPNLSLELALSLGGILLVHRSLRKASIATTWLVEAAISWKQSSRLIQAAARPEQAGRPELILAPQPEQLRPNGRSASAPIVDARELVFHPPRTVRPVLRDCSLCIHQGDRILLQGASGSGKTTLGAMLSGLRTPDAGLLLLNGMDWHSLGLRGWRQRVVAAPQFHENYIFTGSLAFNLLLGRRWPPSSDDLREAETVCQALDLGSLLRRMPAGMFQMVGETGWQLSHGERSRIFLARALLQGAGLIVLDESFGALDPETLRRSLRYTLERAPTVLLIAHP